jgi:hypothetical protein
MKLNWIMVGGIAVGMALAAWAQDSGPATVEFKEAPPGTTITYTNAQGITQSEMLRTGVPYPATAVVQFNQTGSVTVNVTGGSPQAQTVIQGVAGGSFDLGGSSPVGGVIVKVVANSSNVRVSTGGGSFTTVPAGGSSRTASGTPPGTPPTGGTPPAGPPGGGGGPGAPPGGGGGGPGGGFFGGVGGFGSGTRLPDTSTYRGPRPQMLIF